MTRDEIQAFWSWFGGISQQLAGEFHDDHPLLAEIDARLSALAPDLSWEIGPGVDSHWRFAVSPNLDSELREQARRIVEVAPDIPNWHVVAERPPKAGWNYRFQLRRTDGGSALVDASGWKFVLLRYPSGEHEVLLAGSQVSSLDQEERDMAAAIVLESILGETRVLDADLQYELVDKLEARFEDRARPIQDLASTFS